MKQLIIIGARGAGQEVFSLAQRAIGFQETFEVKGYLDDKADAFEGIENLPPILGSVENYQIQENDVFICALGSVYWKKYYVDLLKAKGGEFISLIDKTTVLGTNCKIGEGCIISSFVVVSNNAVLKDFVFVHPFTTFGHDVIIGNYVHVGAYVFFGGFTVVEDEVSVFVRATVFDRIIIGKNTIIGAGVVVRKNITANTKVIK